MDVMQDPSVHRARSIHRTLVAALTGNTLSVVIKLSFGIMANSIAMMADAVHSILDSSSSLIGIYGNRVSSKPPDPEHPYGHKKFEYVASIGITMMLFIALFNILREAINRILSGIAPSITFYTYAAMITSMGISLSISLYEMRIGKRTSSIILMADSYHSLTDVFASIVVIASFVGTQMNFTGADPLASIVVCLFIAYIGLSLFRQSATFLLDRGISQGVISQIKEIVAEVGKDADCHDVRGRIVGEKIFVDLHMTVKGSLSVEEAHEMAEDLEKRMKKSIAGMEEVIVHIEPNK